jgi:hypothetical protein
LPAVPTGPLGPFGGGPGDGRGLAALGGRLGDGPLPWRRPAGGRILGVPPFKKGREGGWGLVACWLGVRGKAVRIRGEGVSGIRPQALIGCFRAPAECFEAIRL